MERDVEVDVEEEFSRSGAQAQNKYSPVPTDP